jgi:hypothetical protein
MAYEFPLKFKKCPLCGCKETVTREAWRQVNGAEREDVAYKHEAVPLIESQSQVLTQLTVQVLVVHKDICANCGMEYCTIAEIGKAPVQAQPPPGQSPRQPWQGNHPFRGN